MHLLHLTVFLIHTFYYQLSVPTRTPRTWFFAAATNSPNTPALRRGIASTTMPMIVPSLTKHPPCNTCKTTQRYLNNVPSFLPSIHFVQAFLFHCLPFRLSTAFPIRCEYMLLLLIQFLSLGFWYYFILLVNFFARQIIGFAYGFYSFD